MRIADAWRLVGPKFKQHRKRVILTVIPMSFLFGIAIMCCLLTPCFEKTLLNAMNDFGDGSVYLAVNLPDDVNLNDEELQEKAKELYEESDDPEKAYPYIMTDPATGVELDEPVMDWSNEFAKEAVRLAHEKLTAEYLEFVKQETADMKVELVEGEVFRRIYSKSGSVEWGGSRLQYGENGDTLRFFDDENYARPYVQTDYADDEIPVLVNIDTAARAIGVRKFSAFMTVGEREALLDQIYAEAIGKQLLVDFCHYEQDAQGNIDENSKKCDAKAKFKIVGLMPLGMSYDVRNGAAFVDPIFSAFSSLEATYENFVLVKDTSEARRFYDFDTEPTSYAAATLKFANYEDAKVAIEGYYNCKLNSLGRSSTCLNVTDVSGGYAYLHLLMSVETAIFRTIYAFLSVLAVIVMAISMRRVMLDEGELIVLYRALGASKKDVRKIYALYIARMTLRVMLWSLIVGVVLTAGIILIEQPEYMSLVSAGFATRERFRYMSVGFSFEIFAVLGCIALAGVISYIFATRKLSRRYLRDK